MPAVFYPQPELRPNSRERILLTHKLSALFDEPAIPKGILGSLVFSGNLPYRETKNKIEEHSRRGSWFLGSTTAGVCMTTSPISSKAGFEPVDGYAGHDIESAWPGRVERLEHDVAELRDTITRFADLVLGQVKDLRQSHADLPAASANGEAHSTSTGPGYAAGHIAIQPTSQTRRPWLLMELLRDLGTTVRMYLDPRYRVRRATQMLVPLILLLFGFNCFFFNVVFTLPVISTALEKLADVILAILLYKIISRELVRYREVIAQLMTWQTRRERSTTLIVNAEPPTTRLDME